MKVYANATLTCPDADVYEALGVEFPIDRAHITWSGSVATISVPTYETDADGNPKIGADGRPVRSRNKRLDRLTGVSEPAEVSGTNKLSFSGASELLADGMNVDPSDVTVRFVIDKYASIVQ